MTNEDKISIISANVNGFTEGLKVGRKETINNILDKIRAEIKALSPEPIAYDVVDGNPIKDAVWETLVDVLQIIDKYRQDEEQESEKDEVTLTKEYGELVSMEFEYGSDSGCPVTCSQYRDGWNDAMEYVYKNGKGYQPYRRKRVK